MTTRRVLIRAAMAVDAERVRAAPAALLVEDGKIVAVGAPESIGTPSDARVLEHRDAVLVPALVNAHAHLDLSHLEPMPYAGDFTAWIEMIRLRRHTDEAGIEAAVRKGVDLLRAGGTALVGDIAGAGSAVPIRVLRELGVPGVGYLEVFGVGAGQSRAIERLRQAVEEIPDEASGLRLGLSPHAPYSCGPEVYRAALELGNPVATHLAETPEELQHMVEGSGPLTEFLVRLGLIDRDVAVPGRHPVDALGDARVGSHPTGPLTAVHLNYLEPRHVERLATWEQFSVAYCPRASTYFGHPRAGGSPHRYRELMAAGITVALGTDGLLCIDTPDRISVLDEMRLLYRRDGAPPRLLLGMATVSGARSLGFDPEPYTLRPGATAGILAVGIDPASGADPLEQVLRRADPPRWVIGPPGVEREAPARTP
jgi:cytosine/adenosine deaminase-related metal-dependent hydrolase